MDVLLTGFAREYARDVEAARVAMASLSMANALTIHYFSQMREVAPMHGLMCITQS